jgi:hypothetical protein
MTLLESDAESGPMKNFPSYLRLLAMPLACLALTHCASSVDSEDVAGAVATTLIKAPFVLVGAILDGDDDDGDSSSDSIGKRHVGRQSSGNQPQGVR